MDLFGNNIKRIINGNNLVPKTFTLFNTFLKQCFIQFQDLVSLRSHLPVISHGEDDQLHQVPDFYSLASMQIFFLLNGFGEIHRNKRHLFDKKTNGSSALLLIVHTKKTR